ncbi:MAG: ribonuclease P protein component [Planctomycetaceae bacterium]|jgi:ribonuclease P protein component|nr:ribonuclease P protein component [Planctomycetaceae bacterium]
MNENSGEQQLDEQRNEKQQPRTIVKGSCYRFPKTLRLRRKSEFQQVYDEKNSVADDTLIIYAKKNELAHPRLGLAITRKIGNAVIRNKWKRLIRESFRMNRDKFDYGIDIVVIAKNSKQKPTLATITKSLISLANKLASR